MTAKQFAKRYFGILLPILAIAYLCLSFIYATFSIKEFPVDAKQWFVVACAFIAFILIPSIASMSIEKNGSPD